MRTPVVPGLRRLSSDEYRARPWTGTDRRVLAQLDECLPGLARDLSVELPDYVESRLGTAAMLRAIDDAAGGGFYEIGPDAERDTAAADEILGGDEVVIDVQTHLVNPMRLIDGTRARLLSFLREVAPDLWRGEVESTRLNAAAWLAQVFAGSETRIALISSFPGRAGESPLTNAEIAACRDVVDRFAGTGRVLTHTIVHPNLGVAELESMATWRDEWRPSGWKVYTLWEPPEWRSADTTPSGWMLDDQKSGLPFLEQVRDIGPRVVCAHKGVDIQLPYGTPAGASPRDIGPAARAFPDITFVVYHSGYQPDAPTDEGPFIRGGDHRGVDRLIASMLDADIAPGANVYAELGSTWFLLMRKPLEAAHVLGKLLQTFGEDRIVWGTDSVWYGPPQYLIDAFRAFSIPEWMSEEHGYPALTMAAKEKILGTNAMRIYNLDASAVPPPDERPAAWLGPATDAQRALFSGV